jgi:hypothetical protein
MEAVCSSETSVSTYKFTLRYKQEDQHRYPDHRENLRAHIANINSRIQHIRSGTILSTHDGGGENFRTLSPWSRVLLEKPTVAQLVKKFLESYWIRSFIVVLTRAFHWSKSSARQSHPPSFDHLTISDEEYKLWSSPLFSFLQPPTTLTLSSTNTNLTAYCQ